jgi:hypothetical protein
MVIASNQKGTCPHCKTPNRFEGVKERDGAGISYFGSYMLITGAEDRTKQLRSCRCTECGEVILFFEEQMIYPWGAVRNSAPREVPTNIGQDFNEACLVESLSKKASAALARRCLQGILHQQGITRDNLSREIDEAMTTLPSHLSEAIDAIRNIGNFAAHPTKSTNTGDIIEVEEGETEWILDVLEQLFDFYYVQPAVTLAKKAALDAKLQIAGKPPSK